MIRWIGGVLLVAILVLGFVAWRRAIAPAAPDPLNAGTPTSEPSIREHRGPARHGAALAALDHPAPAPDDVAAASGIMWTVPAGWRTAHRARCGSPPTRSVATTRGSAPSARCSTSVGPGRRRGREHRSLGRTVLRHAQLGAHRAHRARYEGDRASEIAGTFLAPGVDMQSQARLQRLEAARRDRRGTRGQRVLQAHGPRGHARSHSPDDFDGLLASSPSIDGGRPTRGRPGYLPGTRRGGRSPRRRAAGGLRDALRERFAGITARARRHFERGDWLAGQRDSDAPAGRLGRVRGRVGGAPGPAARRARPGRRHVARDARRFRGVGRRAPGREAGGNILQLVRAPGAPRSSAWTRGSSSGHRRGDAPRRGSARARRSRRRARPARRGARRFAIARTTSRRTIEAVLRAYAFDVPWDDLGEATRAAWRRVSSMRPARAASARVELARPVFFRGKAAYRVGRLLTDGAPRAAAARAPQSVGPGGRGRGAAHRGRGEHRVQLRARLLLRGAGRRPRELVEYLRAIMPRKPVSELYTAIGLAPARQDRALPLAAPPPRAQRRPVRDRAGPARHGDVRVHAPGLRRGVQGHPRPLRPAQDGHARRGAREVPARVPARPRRAARGRAAVRGAGVPARTLHARAAGAAARAGRRDRAACAATRS